MSYRVDIPDGDACAGHDVEFGLLGPVEVRVDGRAVELPPKHRTLLAALLLEPGRVVPVGELAEAVWGGAQPANPRRAVQLYVTRLRGLLGFPVSMPLISTHAGGYQVNVRPGQTDLGRFHSWLEQAEDAARRADLDAEANALGTALAQWRGKPLAGLPSELLQRQAAPRLGELRLQALERFFDVELRRGRHAELVSELVAATAEHPLRERLWAQLVTALYASGRRADALEAYHTVREHLADELGVDPSEELQSLHARVLAGRATSPRDVGPAGSGLVLPPVPRQLPADVPAFAGRAAELARLDALLAGQRDQNTGVRPMLVCVVAGTAGVGKTTLAVHWARRVADRFPDGQLWVNLRGFSPRQTVAPEQALTRFLRALGVPDVEIPLDVHDKASLYRSLMDGRRMLVVLDNAHSAEQVRPLLPGSPGCLVVVTSRNQLSGLVAAEGAHPLVLDLLSREEAHQLLARRLGTGRVQDEASAVEDIISLCARLPLALAIAAARAAAHAEFELNTLAVDLRSAHGSLDVFTADRVPEMRTVFSWSYQALTSRAARLFRLLGLHPGPDIGVPAAASLAGVPVPQVRSLLTELADANLLVEHVPGRYAFHDLLRTYATELAAGHDPSAVRQAAQHRMFDHYLHTAHQASLTLHPHEDPLTPPPARPGVTVGAFADGHQALAWFGAELNVLVALIDQAAGTGFPTHTWRLAWALTDYLVRQGQWHDSASTLETALAAASEAGAAAEQARSHRALAWTYTRLGRFGLATTNCERALDLFRELDDQAELAHTHRALGVVLEAQGRQQESLDHDMQALDLFRAIGHPTGEGRALNAVGWDHACLGDFTQAFSHCEKALALLNEHGDLLGQAATWDSLGYAHHHLGRHHRAVACYQRALNLWPELGDRYNEADTLTRLGDAHLAAGDTEAARTAWQRALHTLTDLGHRAAEPIRARLRDLHQAHSQTAGGPCRP